MLELAGIGIHSGERTRVRIFLTGECSHIHFKRGRYVIPAHVDYVRATPRCTVLGLPRIAASRVATVEHFLAACACAGWWRGLLVEVEGSELPILDGSAQEWLELLCSLGTPPAIPTPYRLKKVYRYRHKKTQVQLQPASRLSIHSSIDFPQPAIGKQAWQGEDFQDVMAARTFGFYEELALLQQHGFALGASEQNVLVFNHTSPMVIPRHANEPARHKTLDALGDFFLLGRPLQAKMQVIRGSHRCHIAAMRQLIKRQLLCL